METIQFCCKKNQIWKIFPQECRPTLGHQQLTTSPDLDLLFISREEFTGKLANLFFSKFQKKSWSKKETNRAHRSFPEQYIWTNSKSQLGFVIFQLRPFFLKKFVLLVISWEASYFLTGKLPWRQCFKNCPGKLCEWNTHRESTKIQFE